MVNSWLMSWTLMFTSSTTSEFILYSILCKNKCQKYQTITNALIYSVVRLIHRLRNVDKIPSKRQASVSRANSTATKYKNNAASHYRMQENITQSIDNACA